MSDDYLIFMIRIIVNGEVILQYSKNEILMKIRAGKI